LCGLGRVEHCNRFRKCETYGTFQTVRYGTVRYGEQSVTRCVGDAFIQYCSHCTVRYCTTGREPVCGGAAAVRTVPVLYILYALHLTVRELSPHTLYRTVPVRTRTYSGLSCYEKYCTAGEGCGRGRTAPAPHGGTGAWATPGWGAFCLCRYVLQYSAITVRCTTYSTVLYRGRKGRVGGTVCSAVQYGVQYGPVRARDCIGGTVERPSSATGEGHVLGR
jgi:hypothetical protein